MECGGSLHCLPQFRGEFAGAPLFAVKARYRKMYSEHRQRVSTMAKRKIVAFRQDEHGDWVAELECGHNQHVRHNPPRTNRPWVVTTDGRQDHVGHELECPACEGKT